MTPIELYADRRPSERRTWSAAIIGLGAVFFLIGGLTGAANIHVLKSLHLYPMAEWARTDIAAIVIFGVTIALVMLWVRFFERRPLAGLGFNGQTFKRLARGAGIGWLSLSLVIALIWGFGGYRVSAPGIIQSGLWVGLLPVLALLAGTFIQSTFEEVVLRGWLMPIVASRHGLWAGIVLSTAIFTALHAVNIKASPELTLGLINVFLAGSFLALYAITERSLWGVCAWHATWNWLLGTGFALKVSGATPGVPPLIAGLEATPASAWWLTGGSFGPEASIVTTAVLMAGVVFLAVKSWPLLTGTAKPDPA
jgi:uncharacterized protein